MLWLLNLLHQLLLALKQNKTKQNLSLGLLLDSPIHIASVFTYSSVLDCPLRLQVESGVGAWDKPSFALWLQATLFAWNKNGSVSFQTEKTLAGDPNWGPLREGNEKGRKETQN